MPDMFDCVILLNYLHNRFFGKWEILEKRVSCRTGNCEIVLWPDRNSGNYILEIWPKGDYLNSRVIKKADMESILSEIEKTVPPKMFKQLSLYDRQEALL